MTESTCRATFWGDKVTLARCLATICLSTFPALVWSADWIPLPARFQSDTFELSADADAAKLEAMGFWVWVKRERRTPLAKPDADGWMSLSDHDYARREVFSERSRYAINCRDRSFAVTYAVTHNVFGEVLQQSKAALEPGSMSEIVPDTLPEALYSLFCKAFVSPKQKPNRERKPRETRKDA